MSLLRRRAGGRSCSIHGDNGCEIQGEAGPRTRARDTRAWLADINDEIDHAKPTDADLAAVKYRLRQVGFGGASPLAGDG